MTPFISQFAADLAQIAHEGGRLVLKHYSAGLAARVKADSSPVTVADEEAEALILARLARLAPGVPIVAEEEMATGRVAPDLGTRFFLVDPLDGTKEFLKRNGEFTVNIALIEMARPVCGVVVAPAMGRAFIGEGANGAYEVPGADGAALNMTKAKSILVRKPPNDGLVAITSRSNRDTKTGEYLAGYRVAEMKVAGSSVKFCLLACGEADLYPRHGRTMEWDTAAGQAVLEAAGGSVKTLAGERLLYGKSAEGFANPHFIARGAE